MQPGEAIILTEGGLRTRIVGEPERSALCVFEHIYFARPDSRMGGNVLQVTRARMGEILWREAPVDADVVIPVPDSGNAAAAASRALPACPRTTASSRTVTWLEPSSSPGRSCAGTG